MSSRVSVDLTALRPASLGPEGEIRPVWPSFCLPWFQGEAPMVGELARVHRRSSDPLAWELESCLELDRRGRYHFAESWLAQAREADSIHPANVEIVWTPSGEERDRVTVSFPDVIRAVLEERATPDSVVALVVPDALGPGPAQEILECVSSRFRRVQLVPRTVAAAVAWCRSMEWRLQLEGGTGEPGSREGSLLVTTTAADNWEAAVVPIRFEGPGAEPLFCPIHERVQHRSEIGVCGLERALAPGASPAEEEAVRIWSSWLQDPGEALRLVGDGPDWDAMSRAFARWSLVGRMDRRWQPHNAENEVRRAVRLAQERHGILGWIHVDSFGTGGVPVEFDFLEDFDLPAPVVETPEVLLRGAAEVIRLLDEGATPYYESLAQVDLYVQGRNDYLDPVEDWQPLIEATEVPVGKTYESPEPIRGLSLPPGEKQVIDLVIRVHRRGEKVLGEFRAEQNKPQEGAVPVRIEARLRPGQGPASFVVESETPGLFHAEVRESRVVEREVAPEILYSWPPGSAWVVSDPHLAREAKPFLARLVTALQTGVDLSARTKAARQEIGKWYKQDGTFFVPDDVPSEIYKQFIYFGVIPSDVRPAYSGIESLLSEIIEEVPVALTLNRGTPLERILFTFSSWLYARCPVEVLDRVRRVLSDRAAVLLDSQFSCVGNCFTEEEDFRLFYRYLVRANRRGELSGYPWIRAWRNLVRFRVQAMNTYVLSREEMQELCLAYLTAFEESEPSWNGQSIYLHCCYLAPHLLKRRRFDIGFLPPDDPGDVLAERFVSVLQWARRQAPTNKLRENLDCALLFFSKRADSRTLQRLSQVDSN
jgi:hypothetical protein